MNETCDALVIGAGPAGLMAAEALACNGRKVIVAEGRPSPARKFLMAGKSGLNLTRDQPDAIFQASYPETWIRPYVSEFGPARVMDWARELGQDVFSGSTGRVFPVAMKASPLLRAWLARLSGRGVILRNRWLWQGFAGKSFRFLVPDGERLLKPAVTVLALGGASWPRLGSDAAWVPWLTATGVGITPFHAANMGFGVNWSPHMARHFGQPVKGVALLAGDQHERGEFVISSRGIEGGGIYAASRALRMGAVPHLDLMPDVSGPDIAARLARMRAGETLSNRLRKLGLSPVSAALVMEFGKGLPIEQAIKTLPLGLTGPFPLTEAISSAGGITAASLTPDLELRTLPGIFACGEMLDWEAPTGGYLLTACLATGHHAGQAAARE